MTNITQEQEGMPIGIPQRIINIIIDRGGLVPDSVKPDSEFIDLGFDSLDFVELTMAIETEFKVSIPDEVTMDLKTVRDLIKYIESTQV